MEIIIIDDEKIAVKETKKIIKRIAFITNIRINVKEFTKYNLELLKNIKNKNTFKIYILATIISGEKSGIEIAKIIRDYDINSEIIFLTNHSDKFIQVHENVRSVYHFITKGPSIDQELTKDIINIINNKYVKRFEYHTIHNDISLNYNSITHISRDKKERKLIIHTNENVHKVSMTFNEIKNYLDGRFKMSHRACLVNTERVENYDWKNKNVILDNGKSIPYLSKNYKNIVDDI